MSIQFFEEFESNSGELLFAKEYLELHPKENGKEFGVIEVSLAQSNKGYMVKTDAFICWLWKRSSTAILLAEALEVYVRDQYGFAIVAVLDKSQKNGYRLGVDGSKPATWFGTGKKYSVNSDIPTFDVQNVNPFLIPHVPSPPITLMTSESVTTNGKSPKSNGKTI